jgi:carboxynorspermidine decarboxylase
MPKNEEIPFIEPWIDKSGWDNLDFTHLNTPCYVVSEKHLQRNLEILDLVQKEAGCKILMALKSFSMFSVFPLIRSYLPGSEASSVNEARLGAEEFGGEMHVFSPSYTEDNILEYLQYADHLVFNSFSQWNRFKGTIRNSEKKVSCGIRINPEHSEAENPMYDPSGPNSHFGVTRKNFEAQNLQGIDGLHFHNLCELDADALVRTLKIFEEKFGEFLPQMRWVNFGGGHHITRQGYNTELLIGTIKDFRRRNPHLDVYLEPGEAIALNAGVLVATVVDILQNEMNIAVLDVSATTHMPDVLEVPYLPAILDAKPAETNSVNVYRIVGPTCLTGDVIGIYEFPDKLVIGQKLVFMNMAIYTMVKNNTFNGVNLPDIAVMDKIGIVKIIRSFVYQDFKGRLS